jgi:steroid delta-isomerase-like uncharacterized protein
MKPVDVVRAYFSAWNNHDATALMGAFAEGGTYSNPSVPEGVSGSVIGVLAGAFFTAFPNITFELLHITGGQDGAVAVEWIMRGTNSGSFWGQPPTHRKIALPGADFITVEGDKIKSLRGYYDRKALVEQVGLKVIYKAEGEINLGL